MTIDKPVSDLKVELTWVGNEEVLEEQTEGEQAGEEEANENAIATTEASKEEPVLPSTKIVTESGSKQ